MTILIYLLGLPSFVPLAKEVHLIHHPFSDLVFTSVHIFPFSWDAVVIYSTEISGYTYCSHLLEATPVQHYSVILTVLNWTQAEQSNFDPEIWYWDQLWVKSAFSKMQKALTKTPIERVSRKSQFSERMKHMWGVSERGFHDSGSVSSLRLIMFLPFIL